MRRAPSSLPKRRRRYLWTRRTRRGLQSLVQTWTVNRKASSSTSSVRIEISLHGPKRTCRVFRRISPSTSYTSEPTRSRSSSLCRLSEEKRRIVGEEIARLLTAGFIMEVFFPEWLANPVLVLKKNNKWCMCIDYTSLNKACPKDPFALPRIDQVIDSTAGCELLSFLDAYSGYH